MNITPEVIAQVKGLELRKIAVQKRMVWMMGGLGASTLIASAISWLANSQNPDAHPSAIDLPITLLNLFEGGSAAGAGLSTIGDSVTSLATDVVGPMSMAAGVCGLMLAGFNFMKGSNPLPHIVMSVGMFLSGQMVPAMLGIEGSGASPRQNFVYAANDHDRERVIELLKEVNYGDNIETQYVLAQISIARKETSELLHSVAKNLDNNLLSPPPVTRYALETAAFGSPRSSIAKNYHSAAITKSEGTTRWAFTAWILTGFGACIAGSLMMINIKISNRLARIKHLIGDGIPNENSLSGLSETPVPKVGSDAEYRKQFFPTKDAKTVD